MIKCFWYLYLKRFAYKNFEFIQQHIQTLDKEIALFEIRMQRNDEFNSRESICSIWVPKNGYVRLVYGYVLR